MTKSSRNLYPCGICEKPCGDGTIQCEKACQKWIHRECASMSEIWFDDFSKSRNYFVCPKCVWLPGTGTHSKQYNFARALLRISASPTKMTVSSGRKLIEFYKAEPFIVKTPESSMFGYEDKISVSILRRFHGIMLEAMSPRAVIADGNCMYRAASLALYGHEDEHQYLRLVTAMEVIDNHQCYDSSSSKVLANVRDFPISPISKVIRDVTKSGTFSEMVHLYALSAALGCVISSYMPPTIHIDMNNPYNRLVSGRGVTNPGGARFALMWTALVEPSSSELAPNHFVYLAKTPKKVNSTQAPATAVFLSQAGQREKIEMKKKVGGPLYRLHSSDVESSDSSNSVTESTPKDKQRNQNRTFDVSPIQSQPTATVPRISTKRPSGAPVASFLSVSGKSPTTADGSNHSIGSAPATKKSRLSKDNEASGSPIKTLEFKDINSVATILRSAINVLPVVPSGHKSNVAFVVKLDRNSFTNRAKHHDDCGAWSGTKSSAPTTRYVLSGDRLTYVAKRNGLFCTGGRNGKWVVIEPQPVDKDVVVCHRYYSSLSGQEDYRKRVTWFENYADCEGSAYVEYQGQHRSNRPHGNAVFVERPYVRTRPETMERIKEATKHRPARDVYGSMINMDSIDAPRDLLQVRQAKCRVRRAGVRIKPAVSNVAEYVMEIIGMMNSHPFVKKIFFTSGKPPTVVLYTEQQINDVQRFCCGKDARSVVGVDRTFNLGACFVTVIVYTNLSVVRSDTRTNPTFVGPMFLHWDGCYGTYVDFLTEVKSALQTPVRSTEIRISKEIILGSDEEKGLTKALDDVFPESSRLLCVQHLRENINNYMQNKCGVKKTQRRELIKDIFGDNGLVNSNDSVVFQETATEMAAKCNAVSQELGRHFEKHVEPALRQYVFEPRQQNPWIPRRWTNNACESANHLLKLSIEWRPRRLPELVDKLHAVVERQHSDVRRAVHGSGNYLLAERYKRFEVELQTWQAMDKAAKDKHLADFRAYKLKEPKQKMVKSSNGALTMPHVRRVATKPHQRKRSKTERAQEKRK